VCAFTFYSYDDDDDENLDTDKIDLYCRWLYQTARADGKPRMFFLGRVDEDFSAPVFLFIDRIKQVTSIFLAQKFLLFRIS
jgi:hypothetical protein